MSLRPPSSRCTLRLLAGAMVVLMSPGLTRAQVTVDPPLPTQPQTFDPSDVYFQGYLNSRDAENLEAEGNILGAHEKMLRAQKMIEAIRLYYPDWKPDMVKGRLEKTNETIARLQPEADKIRLAEMEKGKVFAEIEGGAKIGGHLIDPSQGAQPLGSVDLPGGGQSSPPPLKPLPLPRNSIQQADPLANQALARAEAEVARLRQLLKDDPNASRSGSRARDLQIQRDQLQAQLNRAQTDLAALRARLAVGPVQGEFDDLNRKIESLDQEREAMGKALTQSRNLLLEEKAKNATLQADLLQARREKANIERDAALQQDVANSVVKGQRAQITELEETVKRKDAELASANQRIDTLQQQLDQSLESNKQLQTEYDSLLKEKEQMAALLLLNDSGRIQELIEQNVALGKQLREAEERVERLAKEGTESQDLHLQSLRDLAIAKIQINKLQADRREQDKRLQDLEARLKSEEQSLAAGATSPQEVEALRDIIKKQLLVQNRRRQAKEELIEAVKQRGMEDEALTKAIELFDGAEIALTPDEQKLIASTSDLVIQSQSAPPREHAINNIQTLARESEAYDSLAKRAFASGRLLSARELYQMSVDENPGNTAALCKLGFIQMKLEDYPSASDTFRRASELNPDNPFAYRMLGVSQMNLNDIVGAEQAWRKAIEVAPADAVSRVYLGVIESSRNDLQAAESEFRAALAADPSQKDAYYNLAVILSKTDRKEEAKGYYFKALQFGALPDVELEKKMGLD
jgi:Flp pilus assembly protein TadD